MDFSNKEPIFETIATYYRRLIVLGVLKEGDALPSVREVAIGENVNPNTVVRAYGLLTEEGVVTAIPKKGYFVSKGVKAEEEEALVNELKALLAKGFSKEEIIRTLNEIKEERK